MVLLQHCQGFFSFFLRFTCSLKHSKCGCGTEYLNRLILKMPFKIPKLWTKRNISRSFHGKFITVGSIQLHLDAPFQIIEKSVKRSGPINTRVQTEFQSLWCMYILCSSFVLLYYEERLLSLVGNKSLSLLNAANQPMAMFIGYKHRAVFPCLLCTNNCHSYTLH